MILDSHISMSHISASAQTAQQGVNLKWSEVAPTGRIGAWKLVSARVSSPSLLENLQC